MFFLNFIHSHTNSFLTNNFHELKEKEKEEKKKKSSFYIGLYSNIKFQPINTGLNLHII